MSEQPISEYDDELYALWKKANQARFDEQPAQAAKMLTEIIEYLERELLEAHETRWVMYYDLGDVNLQLAELNWLIEHDPQPVRRLMLRASTFMQLHDSENALADLNKVIELEPSHSHAHQRRAQLYFELGNYAGSIEDLNVAMAQEDAPDQNANYLRRRGNAYFMLGDYQNALKDFNDALQVDQNHNVLLTADIHHSRGHTYAMLNQPEKALEDFNQAQKLRDKPLYDNPQKYIEEHPFKN